MLKITRNPKKNTPYPPLEGPMNTLGLFTTDPMGSYTGRPIDPEEKPIQDADDL